MTDKKEKMSAEIENEEEQTQAAEDSENVQNNPDAVMEIRKIRADLSELFFEIQKAKKQEEN